MQSLGRTKMAVNVRSRLRVHVAFLLLFLILLALASRGALWSRQCQGTGARTVAEPQLSLVSVRPPAGTQTTPVRAQPPWCSSTVPTNIVFLKVHKSGSTTVANIMARYALNHDLNIALPNKSLDHVRCNYFSSFKPKWHPALLLAEGQQYNVLFNHMIYNRKALDRLMPPDTFYCAIMREPLSRFISSANYYYHLLPYPLREYLVVNDSRVSGVTNTPEATRFPGGLESTLTDQVKRHMSRSPELYNTIALDSGMAPRNLMKPKAVKAHVKKLDRELDLMMVMERFNESLVLLKRRARLHTKDIVYLRLNFAKACRLRKLTDTDRQVLRVWQMADHVIYNHFYRRFQAEVRREESFKEEVRDFRYILTRVQEYCKSKDPNDVLVIKATRWYETFTLNSEDCNMMKYEEMDFHKKLVARAESRLQKMQSRKPTLYTVPKLYGAKRSI